uniref:Uncharacterized protein n=1 Tax=Knipowitschia caucasica TaxID=637954 RepID=A0AAV2MNW2_KNICA
MADTARDVTHCTCFQHRGQHERRLAAVTASETNTRGRRLPVRNKSRSPLNIQNWLKSGGAAEPRLGASRSNAASLTSSANRRSHRSLTQPSWISPSSSLDRKVTNYTLVLASVEIPSYCSLFE